MKEKYYLKIGNEQVLLGYDPEGPEEERLKIGCSSNGYHLSFVSEEDIPTVKRDIKLRREKGKNLRLKFVEEEILD